MEDNRTSEFLYAYHYSRIPITGIRFLMFRDLPIFLNKFVRGTKTLDYGCGPGHSSMFLKSLGLEVDGVDINKHMINCCKNLDPEGNYVTINSAEIPTSDEHYDFAYAGLVLPYAENKQQLTDILTEIARVLKPGGIFITVVPSENAYEDKYKWLADVFDQHKEIRSGMLSKVKYGDLNLHHYYWSDADLLDVISKTDLKLIHRHQPLGKDSDGFPWKSEMNVPIANAYVMQK